MEIIKNSVLTMSLVLGACEQAGTLPLDSAQQQQIEENGLQLNGSQNNGLQLNGLQLNGLQLNGLQLNGLQLNGLQLNGSQLGAYSTTNQVLLGPELAGTILNITMNPGARRVAIKINAVYTDPQNPGSDILLYDASYQAMGSSTWTSVCTDASGNPVPGIPLTNYWNMTSGARIDDSSVITFACVNGAIGKCVRWGYRPWATATKCTDGSCSQVSLKDYHQACTRMVRADYCGNGTGNTVTGTQIDVYDGLSPQLQSPSTSWPVEAKWTPSGATCIGNTRGADLIKKFQYPDCNRNKKNDDFPACVETDYTVTGANLLGDNYNSTQNTRNDNGSS